MLTIKDAETDRLARELAAEAGESLTVATRRAIEERLARIRARKMANNISAVNRVELGIVLEARQGSGAVAEAEAMLDRLAVTTEPVDAAQASAAFAAWPRFGKGRDPAGRNLGAGFSDALARAASASLPFKGNAFAPTDIASAR